MVNAFVKSLERLPRSQVIIGSVLASLGLSALLTGYTAAVAKPCVTCSAEWRAATNQYLKFQNCNPIFGISSKK